MRPIICKHYMVCVLQRVAACCSVLQCDAACCSVFHSVAVRYERDVSVSSITWCACCSVMHSVAECCSVLQYRIDVAGGVHIHYMVCLRCGVLQRVAVRCSVLQCVAECCSVLQCVAVWCSVLQWIFALQDFDEIVTKIRINPYKD